MQLVTRSTPVYVLLENHIFEIEWGALLRLLDNSGFPEQSQIALLLALMLGEKADMGTKALFALSPDQFRENLH